ncbi:hypothetical protein CsSME_00000904 [Camellia sinensis var. sinensis]
MAMIPSIFGGRRSNIFDPFSLDIWDPFSSVLADAPTSAARETSAIANTRIDWKEKNEKWHRVERSSGKFLRRFRLPENVKMDHVKASMEDGVLTVVVPKEEEKKHEVKSIEISG